jgi:hypothetical protein
LFLSPSASIESLAQEQLLSIYLDSRSHSARAVIGLIESDDIRALTWYAWRSGELDAASKTYAQSASSSLEQWLHNKPMIRNKWLLQFFEQNRPRVGEFLIEFVTAEDTDTVKVVLTSQRMWLFDYDLKHPTEIELSSVSSFEWQIRYFLLGYIKAIVKYVDGTVKSIKSGGVPSDDDALNLAIEKCRRRPWAVSLDEKTWASLAADQLEPDPEYNPIGIGVSPLVDALVERISRNEGWLYAGLATWDTIGTKPETLFFQRWINRAFLGVLGDAVTPDAVTPNERGKFGIIAFGRSGNLYIATLGDYSDNREFEARIANAEFETDAIQSQHIAEVSVSIEKGLLMLEIDDLKLALSFPDCFIAENARLRSEIVRTKSFAWKYT